MERFNVGEIVITPFPFSDLSSRKVRPAIVLAIGDHGDLILCQITSRVNNARNQLKLSSVSFSVGKLNQSVSYARPDKLFTCDPKMIIGKTGSLKSSVLKEIRKILIRVFDL